MKNIHYDGYTVLKFPEIENFWKRLMECEMPNLRLLEITVEIDIVVLRYCTAESVFKQSCCPKFIGNEVYKWEEFQAICRRLGIPYEMHTTKITIQLEDGELPSVVHTYVPTDEHNSPAGSKKCEEVISTKCDVPSIIETTTFQNKEFRTYAHPDNRS